MTGQSLRQVARSRLFELVAVFLGVALAFFAENWREYRAERREEQTVLLSLRDEIASNREEMDLRLELYERTRDHTLALLTLLESAERGESVEVPDSLLLAFVTNATYDPARGTIDALIGGGQLGLVQDPTLRARIAAWPSVFANADALQVLQREIVHSVVGPVMARSGVDLGRHWPGSTPFLLGTLPEDMRGTTTLVPATAEVRSIVGQRYQIARLVAINLGRLRDFDIQLLELVESRRLSD